MKLLKGEYAILKANATNEWEGADKVGIALEVGYWSSQKLKDEFNALKKKYEALDSQVFFYKTLIAKEQEYDQRHAWKMEGKHVA